MFRLICLLRQKWTVIYIFNYILCYATSSIESKSSIEIVNECTAFYNEEDIKKANKEICAILNISPIWRRGETRKRDNLEDILGIVEEYIFV